ncbi:MAG: glycosyltransferase family 4 protein [Caulobacterales bacterium]
MKVLVLNNAAPFIRGGAEELADELVRRLNGCDGVEAECFRLPFAWEPRERLIDEVALHRVLQLANVDRVIGLKFPAYLIPHPNKVLWILHQFRQAYDLADAGQSHLGDDETGAAIKGSIRAADDECFRHAKKLFVNSPVTQSRLKRYNGFDAAVLYPPLNDAELLSGGPFGDYVFAGGRVGEGKRQHLLVEALAQAPSAPRLIIAGPPQSDAYAERLRSLVETHGLGARVELHFGFHPRDRIAAWVNGARACACLPFDEDSLSYVAMEACAAGKPVVTVTDSGGVLGLATADTGFVCKPDPEDLARALAACADLALVRRKGAAAAAKLAALGLTWDATLRALLA